MNKEEYVASLNLEINDNIARIVSKVDDEICEVWKIDKKDVIETLNFKEDLIKYLESMLDGTVNDLFVVTSVKNLLERIKSGKYDD